MPRQETILHGTAAPEQRAAPVLAATLLTVALLTTATARAQPSGELVMLAPLDQAMPVVQFDNGTLSGGILKDLGDALAQRLGRRIAYLSVGVDGVTPALTQGRADGMCHVMPNWIAGDDHWSGPLIPDAELIVSSPGAPPVARSRLSARLVMELWAAPPCASAAPLPWPP